MNIDTNPPRSVVLLPCDDVQEVIEFSLTAFDENCNLCEINFMDGYCGVKESKLKYRIKRAWKAFKGEPVYYSGVCIEDLNRVKNFFDECIKSIEEIQCKNKS